GAAKGGTIARARTGGAWRSHSLPSGGASVTGRGGAASTDAGVGSDGGASTGASVTASACKMGTISPTAPDAWLVRGAAGASTLGATSTGAAGATSSRTSNTARQTAFGQRMFLP